jgi:rod shape-determining protein MreC
MTFYFREGEKGVLHQVQSGLLRGLGVVTLPLAEARDGIRNGFKDLFRFRSLRQENEVLRKELARLKSQQSYLEEQSKENNRLRKLLELKASLPFKTVACEVVGYSLQEGEQYLTVDKGSRSGVKEGQAVVVPEGLVGKVIQVHPNFSVVRLLTDAGWGVSARVAGSRHVGIVEFERDSLRLTLIPAGASIKEGDVVVTAGLGGEIPSGIKIGQVSKAVDNPSGVSKAVWLSSEVDFERLEEVLVVQ